MLGDAALRSAAPPARPTAAAHELRCALGLDQAPLRQGGRRTDHRPAVPVLRPADALLRGADPAEGQRRGLSFGRPPAGGSPPPRPCPPPCRCPLAAGRVSTPWPG